MNLNTPKYIPYNKSLPDCIIIDIDGTISHTEGKRGIHEYDKVQGDVLDPCMFKFFEHILFPTIFFITGRNEVCRSETELWLKSNFQNTLGDYNLLMRSEKDRRQDDVMKKEIFELFIRDKYNVLAVFEDRDRVVKMYRELGLLTFQVNYGDF